MNKNEKCKQREYKRLLRQRLYYFLDIVGTENLDEQQRREYNLLVKKLGANSRMISFQTENDQEVQVPVKVDFNQFTVAEYHRLRNLNYSIKEIQDMCGVSEAMLYNWRKANGLVAMKKKKKNR